MNDTKQLLKEFREFILRGNVVDLAVAVAIGTAFTAVVTAAREGLHHADRRGDLRRRIGFESLTFTINGSPFAYGDFLNAVLSFLATAAVVFFFVVKPDQPADGAAQGATRSRAPKAPPEDIRLLTEIRDLLAARETGA